jgi:hypothetical protein
MNNLCFLIATNLGDAYACNENASAASVRVAALAFLSSTNHLATMIRNDSRQRQSHNKFRAFAERAFSADLAAVRMHNPTYNG